MSMVSHATSLEDIVQHAKAHKPISIAVVAADQGVVIEAVREAKALSLIDVYLVGDPDRIADCAQQAKLNLDNSEIVPAKDEAAADGRAA